MAFMNLSTLRSEVGNRLKTPTTLSSSQKDLWINAAQDDVATEMDPDNLVVNTTFSSVASTRKYYIDIDYNKIISVVDQTNNIPLVQTTESELELYDPDFGDTGTSSHWASYGLEFVRGQPSSASVVTVVSSSSADTTQKVRINGTVSGVNDTELLTLNGTSNVAGTKSFTAVHSISLNNTCAGRITATSNSGAVTLATIPIGSYAEEKQPLYLWPTPTAVNTYKIRGYRYPRPMVNVEDFPDMPRAYHELIVIGAVIRGHASLFRYEAAALVKKNEWEPKVAKLKDEMGKFRGIQSPVIQGSIPIRFGGRFPSNYPVVS